MIERPLQVLDRFWFAEAPATRLALLRLLIGGYALLYVGFRFEDFLEVAGASASLFEPVGAARFLGAPIPVEAFRALLALTLIANVAFLVGWRHRYTGPLFAALLLWVMSYRHSWSMVYHSHNLLVLHVLILGLVPAADALSLDSLRRWPLAARRSALLSTWRARDPAGAGEYGYPIRLICAITVATYLLAAVAKVAGPLGWSWADGEALRSQVGFDALRKDLLGSGAPPMAAFLFGHLWLFTAIGVGSLAIEMAAPVALFGRRLGWLWAIGAFLMHWGIAFIMGISFLYHLSGVAFASFFDLDRLAAWFPLRRIGGRLARTPLIRRQQWSGEPYQVGLPQRALASRLPGDDAAGTGSVPPVVQTERRRGPRSGSRLRRRALAVLPVALVCALLLFAVRPFAARTPTASSLPVHSPPSSDPVLDGTAVIDEGALADLAFERAHAGARWLANAVRSDGAFYYAYDPVAHRYETTEYNEVRHAGTAYALFQVYGATRDHDLLVAAENAARYIADQSRPVPDGGRAYVYDGQTKLGGQALALVALLERRRVTQDTSYDPLIYDLATFLLSLERKDPVGRYYHYYDFEQGERQPRPESSFYPGEALLALTRLGQQFADRPYLAYAERAANYLVYQRDGDLPTLGKVPDQDHWLTIALSELYRFAPNQAYATVAYLQAESMLADQYRDGDPSRIGAARSRGPISFTNTATRGEALVAAWGLATFRGDQERVGPIAAGAQRNAQFQMRVQYTEDNSQAFPKPELLVGAWAKDPGEPSVQIDRVQHNISALIGVWHLTREGDLPFARLNMPANSGTAKPR